MLKIRLMRIGAKKKPFYRVVVMHERSKRTGGYVELLGTYNPLTEPKDIKLKQDRIDHWIKQGAQMSVGFLRVIGKAPQRPPRKAKKEVKTETPAAVVPAAEATGETQPTEGEVKSEVTPEETGGAAKPETAKATSAVESAPEQGITTDSDSQQTGSEPQEKNVEPATTEASSALQSGEQSTGPVVAESDTPAEEKK